MGSGYFPLSASSSLAKKISKFIADTESDIDSYAEDASSGEDGQYDNSFYDGQAIGELRLAIRLLQECIEKEYVKN